MRLRNRQALIATVREWAHMTLRWIVYMGINPALKDILLAWLAIAKQRANVLDLELVWFGVWFS